MSVYLRTRLRNRYLSKAVLSVSCLLSHFCFLSSQVIAQEAIAAEERVARGSTPNVNLRTDTDLFWYMLDFQNRQSNKEVALLHNHSAWGNGELVALVGGQARFSFMAAGTNTEGKFPYLGRFPPDFTGNSVTDARILQANAALAVHASSWINLYGELLFSDVFAFPDFKQGSLQTRQAYAVFGNLDETPWYAYIGKKNLSFGDMGTLSPFTQAVPWHYFAGLHEGVGVGYAGERLQLALQGVNGGRGIRVADSEEKGKINNLAANALYTVDLAADARIQLGGGFLLSTIYDSSVAEHIDPSISGDRNSAWDVNALAKLGRFTFAGEYVATVDDWPVVGHPVRAYRAEAAYDVTLGERPGRFSVSWSEGIQGDRGTEFEFNQQLVLGLGIELNSFAMCSLEYVRSMGFAPLIDITTVSDRNVVQDSAILGMTIVF